MCRDVGEQDDLTTIATPHADDGYEASPRLWDHDPNASNVTTSCIVHEAVIRPILEDRRSDANNDADVGTRSPDSLPSKPISAAELTQSVDRPPPSECSVLTV